MQPRLRTCGNVIVHRASIIQFKKLNFSFQSKYQTDSSHERVHPATEGRDSGLGGRKFLQLPIDFQLPWAPMKAATGKGGDLACRQWGERPGTEWQRWNSLKIVSGHQLLLLSLNKHSWSTPDIHFFWCYFFLLTLEMIEVASWVGQVSILSAVTQHSLPSDRVSGPRLAQCDHFLYEMLLLLS